MLESVKQKAATSFNAAKSAVGLQTEKSQVEELAEICPNLTWNQRIWGFGICFLLGYLITFMSFNFFARLIDGDPAPFVIVYTLGNIISILSAMFLCGPKRQFKKMFDDTRRTVTIVYLSTLILSIVLCLIKFEKDAKLGILIVLLIIQFCSSIWYSLSFIPLARRAVKKFFRQQIGADENV